ncbi:type II toxin-antitoxin system RelE/ParE family toxin [Mesorhizobium sp. BH1-1-5]|uniref:type II toxin-antitoxin system RelE/ParE family toxin n=1 Tax=Mesorhizobium sp. BH1-1-5 TaxID=2876661 RepID=UPI0021E3034B
MIELASIGDYIGQHNPRAAARVVNEIHSKTARLLSANPFIGRVGEIKGTRELVISGTPYIVAAPGFLLQCNMAPLHFGPDSAIWAA